MGEKAWTNHFILWTNGIRWNLVGLWTHNQSFIFWKWPCMYNYNCSNLILPTSKGIPHWKLISDENKGGCILLAPLLKKLISQGDWCFAFYNPNWWVIPIHDTGKIVKQSSIVIDCPISSLWLFLGSFILRKRCPQMPQFVHICACFLNSKHTGKINC